MVKYTLDRFDDGYGVLLKHPIEEEQLLISEKYLKAFKEGDILSVEEDEQGYKFIPLEEETEKMKSHVESLINKLKNKSE